MPSTASHRPLVIASTLLLAACTPNTPAISHVSPSPATPTNSIDKLRQEATTKNAHEHQLQALANTTVALQDYAQAIALARECMTEKGLKVGPNVTNRVDGWRLLYSIEWPQSMSAEEGSKHSGYCQDHHVTFLERGFATADRDRMPPELLSATKKCLADKGKTLLGTEVNHRQLQETSGASPQDVTDCVTNTMLDLYPGEQFAVVW